MKTLYFRKCWLMIGAILMMAIIILSLIPNAHDITPAFSGSDKIGHFIAYFILMAWFVQIFFRRHHLKLLMLFVIMGITLESLQRLTDYRSFEYLDILANTSGVIGGWYLGGTRLMNILLGLEQVLMAKGIIKHV